MSDPRSNDWYQRFVAWIAEPCPGGEWLYRGQPAKYDGVIPSAARPGSKDLYGVRLYELNPNLADTVLATSPVFGANGLIADKLVGGTGWSLETFLLASGRLSAIHLQEMLRALAQHYGYPTLFVDITLEPLVGAFFATLTYRDEQYFIAEEPGTLYRWPARRRSRTRLDIAADPSLAQDERDIGAIDISRVNGYLRRPRNQRAVLATPYTRDFLQTVMSPESLYGHIGTLPRVATPLDSLNFTDLAKMPSCQRFHLPAGAGRQLLDSTNVSVDALFPDQIDLGYSYTAVLALLSLVSHEPDITKGQPEGEALAARYESALLMARAILDRECFRLAPGIKPTHVSRLHTLMEARVAMSGFTEEARQAVALFNTEPQRAAVAAARERMQNEAADEFEKRWTIWKQSVEQVVGPQEWKAVDRDAFKIRSGSHDWIPGELGRRLDMVERLIQDAAKVPVYALHDREAYPMLVAAFASDAEYEARVQRQIAAQVAWSGNESAFSTDMNSRWEST